MIVRTVRFAFKDSVTAEQRARALETFEAMASLTAVAFSTVGRSLGGRDAGLTHAHCVAFEDLAALRRYLNDPVLHEGDRKVLPLFARLSVEPHISDDADPDLGTKIAAASDEAVAGHPELARLLREVPQFDIHGA